MVMFKARFEPAAGDRPRAAAKPQVQQQQQPQPQPQPAVPPIEEERGPQHPVREPGPGNPPERAR